jgi:hypothetical protein
MKIWTVLLVATLALSGFNAEAARRLGGGTSFGKQSSNVTKREATPNAPVAPAQGVTNAAPKPAPAAPPAVAPKRPWGAMLGGLAAGLGLAWLAHSLGMGEGMGQFLMFAMLAVQHPPVHRRARLPFRGLALFRWPMPSPTALKTWGTTPRHARGNAAAWLLIRRARVPHR